MQMTKELSRIQEWKQDEERKKDGFKGEKMIILPTEAFSDFTVHPLVKRLYLTDAGFFPKAAHHYIERNAGIDEYIFIFCTEGKGVISVEGKKYVLKANEAFCIPRGRKHRYYACKEEPWSILWLHFKGEDSLYFPLEEYRVVRFAASAASNRILFLFELLFRSLEGNYTLENFIYISQVLSLLLAEVYKKEKKDTSIEYNKHISNVILYMQRHMDENLTLGQLAEIFDLSKSYLNALFKKYTDHAPMDFYNNLKIKEACKLLKTTDLYVYEVAQRLGYKDQYYFSRIFSKSVGVSPRQYKYSDFYNY